MKLGFRIAVQAVLALAVVGAEMAGYQYLTKSRPQVVKKTRPVTAPMVRVFEASLGPVRVAVRGEGTVRPLRDTTLSAQVAGRVVYVSDSLAAGEPCRKDEVILRIDPTDYKLALSLSRAKLKEAETNLFKMREEAEASIEEWSRLNRSQTPPPLVAKKPQLAQARAALEAAEATLRQSELDLQRTEVKVPFEGRVISKSVDLGQVVSRGQAVARIYSTEAAEITVHLEDRDLAWIEVPGLTSAGRNGPGSAALVRASYAGQEMEWPARVIRAEAELDQKTRLTPVVVRVEEPYSRLPPLVSGLYVRVEIRGRTQERASLLPRAAIREGDLVWLVEDGRIRFKPVEILRYQDDMALVSPGLDQGTQVVATTIKAVTEGMRVRTARNAPAAGEDPTDRKEGEEPAPSAAEPRSAGGGAS